MLVGGHDDELPAPGHRAVGSRAEVDFDAVAVAVAWRLDLGGPAEVGSVVLAERLDLGEFGERVEFFVEALEAADGFGVSPTPDRPERAGGTLRLTPRR